MKGIIIAGGKSISKLKLEKLLRDMDLIVAADSGFKHLVGVNKEPDYLVGDLDSIDHTLLTTVDREITRIVRHPVEKDKTDTELAIDVLVENNVKEIFIVGGTGTRLDHTLSNINSLKYMYDRGINGTILDDHNIITYLKGEDSFYVKDKGRYVSILPISSDGVIISLDGFHYPLCNKLLEFGSSLGISNYLEAEEGTITCHKGEIIIIEAID